MIPLVSDFTTYLIVWIALGSAFAVLIGSIIREHLKTKRSDNEQTHD